MKLSEVLFSDNDELVLKCLTHPFVQGLADGSLDVEKFKQYVAQDAFFLKAFFRAYALAASKSSSLEQMQQFLSLMRGVMEELKMHSSYSKELGIDLASIRANPACKAYTEFLIGIGKSGSVAEIMAAMVPCMRLYAHLGTELKKSQTSDTYAKWIEEYSSDDFHSLVALLEGMLDTYEISDTIKKNYTAAMELEYGFFDWF